MSYIFSQLLAYRIKYKVFFQVLEAVMILRGADPSWAESKRQLGEQDFIKQLINFDKDNISDKTLKKIGQYCSQDDFQPDVVGKVSIINNYH